MIVEFCSKKFVQAQNKRTGTDKTTFLWYYGLFLISVKIASDGNMVQEIDNVVDIVWMFEIAKRGDNPIP